MKSVSWNLLSRSRYLDPIRKAFRSGVQGSKFTVQGSISREIISY